MYSVMVAFGVLCRIIGSSSRRTRCGDAATGDNEARQTELFFILLTTQASLLRHATLRCVSKKNDLVTLESNIQET